jgi:tetratricopeptide (TPR) repeat protein
MIVRDEARMIDDCLRSVRGLVTEMIVVDTGSRDDTRERARRAGATVVDVPWTDDFSAARNASLKRARGDWVLILDADERIAACDGRAVRDRLAKAPFDCGMLRLHDAASVESTHADVLSGAARLGDAQRVPRLVRRKPDIAYVGVIHEDLAPWLVKNRARVAPFDLDIIHLGASREVYVDRGKFERNVRLLIALGQQTPEDPTAYGYLAHQYLENGKLAEASAAAEEGWRRLPYVEATRGYRPSVLRLAEARAQVQLKVGDARGALDTVHRARRIEGPHYDLDHIAGYALERLALGERAPVARERYLAGARACFEECLRPSGEVPWLAFVAGATGWASATRLGSVALLQGDGAAAKEAFGRALSERPRHLEARLGLLEARILLGESQAALGLASELIADPEAAKVPDVWVLAARACDALGAFDDMLRFVNLARAQRPEYVSASRRALHGECLVALSLYRGAPIAGPGLVGAIGALAAGQAFPPEDVGAHPSDARVVEILVRNLEKLGRTSLLRPALEPRADVLVPGLRGHLRRALASVGASLEPPFPAAVVVRGPDARFVAGLLASHPRLVGQIRMDDGGATHDGDRIVDTAPEPDARALPFTRVAIVSDPVGACDRLLALVGEGGAEPLVRRVIETYSPGGNGTVPESAE